MEYNHMDELGFTEDKQLICTAPGFLSSANAMKRMCDRFIRNGGRIYDLLTSYDNIMSFGLSREDRRSGDSLKTIVPLLKAAGATDSSVHEYFVKDMSPMPGSDVIMYMSSLMTTAVVSEAYEHHTMALCDSLKIPLDMVRSTEASFDNINMEKQEAKKFREFAAGLSKLDVPKISSGDGMQFIDHKDQMILDTVEDMIEKMSAADVMYQLGEVRTVGGNKA
ncbi:MAG: hypothetical protein LBV13_04005, partial [Methanomassiliicoccaceae archaeon]|nr:hypothetical protein [Methanomassiliicoccaceae archaeon]